MAIDICSKHNLASTSEGASRQANEGQSSVVGLSDEQRERLELSARSALSHVDPHSVAGDPAAWQSDFGYALDRVSVRLDSRPSDELHRQATNHPDPMMREQALFEYADRDEEGAIDLLRSAAEHDVCREVRWAALWAIEKLGGLRGRQALKNYLNDSDPEMAEWARLFLSELQTGDPAFDQRSCASTPGRTFDQTIYLLIHCDLYVRLDSSNRHWGKLSLAPQGLARVYGQGHACPNVETRERQLVIAKCIDGLHDDGSMHVDNYLFRGFTERTRPDRGNFFFESLVKRPFYVSGRADDDSQGVQAGQIGFQRQGCWYLDDRFKIRGADAIRYVRGRFQGWGYVNLARVAGKTLDQILLPGNAVLSTLHDPVAGPLTNAFISGTFKGKLCDWDGDGNVDLNSLNVYSTTEGEIDTNMDGIADHPGVSCCTRGNPLLY